MATQAPAYVPLELPATYKRFTRVEGSRALGDRNALRIDPTGTTLSLLLSFAGEITVPAGGAAPTVHPEAPFNVLRRVILSVNGPGRVHTIPGYALSQFERAREADFVPSFTFSAPANAGGSPVATPVNFDLVIPICVRDGDLVGEWSDYLGCIYTGDPTTNLTVQFEWGDASDVFLTSDAGTTVDGTMTITSFKLDTPNPAADPALLAAISYVHQLQDLQENIAISGAGQLGVLDQIPTAMPRAYLRVLDIIRNNGVPVSGLIDNIDAEIDNAVEFERYLPEQVLLARQKRRYIEGLSAGSYMLDQSAGNRRDNWLAVGSTSLFRLTPTITVPGSVTLTSANLSRYAEMLQPSSLAQKWMAAAAARKAA